MEEVENDALCVIALPVFRLLLSIAVSDASIFGGSPVVLSVWDISVAFFHAVMDELVCVHPPRDLVPPGWCWKLRKSMYGTRRASRLWADNVRRALEDDGSETIAVFSIFLVNRSKRCIVAVWGDDFAFIVASEMVPHLTELLERNFECKLIGNIGPGMPKDVVKLLHRQLAWTESGHETLSICPPEAWPRGGEEHERGESWKQVRTSATARITSACRRWRNMPALQEPCYITLWTGQICSLRWVD